MSLERIRDRLSGRMYADLTDFIDDMDKLFEACLSLKDHRYFKTFMQIKDRFERSI
jgi:hypothetical protein